MTQHLPNNALLRELKKAYAVYKTGDAATFDDIMARVATEFVSDIVRFKRRMEDGFDDVIDGPRREANGHA